VKSCFDTVGCALVGKIGYCTVRLPMVTIMSIVIKIIIRSRIEEKYYSIILLCYIFM
jgi:hypothetical protein